ncbi:MAG: efflux RND transporter permease subunit [Calditrichaeota bacterium]|nr:efflux RND transporter permease subunit [Calditrichota bacterium]
MKGAVKWMAGNHVAANILMLILIVGGLLMGKSIKQEIFPEMDLDMISITVPFPGASPTEVEEGIILPVENAVSAVENIKRVKSTARESAGTVILEIVEGADAQNVLNEVKSEVDRIITFPENAEKPVVSQVTTRSEVITFAVFGDVTERALFEQAELIRDGLLAKPNITQAEITAVRPPEISIEISEENLRRYDLTLIQIAGIIRRASLDLPGGSVKTSGGEILIRTNEKKHFGEEFESVVILSKPSGEKVLLSDIATINDGFLEADYQNSFDGKPAAMISVYRIGKQTPKSISRTVRDYIEESSEKIPSSMGIAVWEDKSEILTGRMELLINNGLLGIILVLIVLALFLEIRLAMWVAVGIAISFLGTMLFMPAFGASINMISLFAFLIVLGIVVDDAIIVGENIFVHYRAGKSLKEAAVSGTVEIMRAVVFAVLTSIVAFSPLLFTSGMMGKFMGVIPIIVIIVLLLSLVESLFILPAHLSGNLVASKAPFWEIIEKKRSKVDILVRWLIDKTYVKTLRWVQHNRYTTLTIALAVLLSTVGFIKGGYIKFIMMPKIDADWITVNVEMSPGTPYPETKTVIEQIHQSGMELISEIDQSRADGESDLLHIYTAIGSQVTETGPHMRGTLFSSNIGQVQMRFKSAEERELDIREFTNSWRDKIGPIPNLERLSISAELMGGAPAIDIQLAHDNYEILLKAIDRVKDELSGYAGLEEIDDSYSEGKRELRLKLKPEASLLGITETDLAMQVRGAFYGSEALRIQRGRNEVRVMVRYPEYERQDLSSVEEMRFRTPSGVEIPFAQAAYVSETRGYSVVNRTDRKRVINVRAKVNTRIANAEEILADLTPRLLDKMVLEYPGLSYDLEGEARDRKESMGSLMRGFILAMFVIFALLAIPFRSFTQPFIVMSAIPFGIVGALIGHLVLGYDLSMISIFGIVALAGIVVNDSLVMIDFINRNKEEGLTVREAIIESGKRRFRPIILTSLTTFFGLMPMMLERSIQAKFLVPMAISLGFGVLFATVITLVLIPALYLILEDITDLFRGKKDIEQT